jgi:uncharacterized protein with von Willebrand factor type A (vWA) domain
MKRKQIEIKITDEERMRILANLVIDKILEKYQNRLEMSNKRLILSQSNK